MSGSEAQLIDDSRSGSRTPVGVAAAILSLLVPGLGQAFASSFINAIAWLMVFIAGSLLALWFFLHVPSSPGLALPLLLIGAIRIAIVVNAFAAGRDGIRAGWGKRIGGVVAFIALYIIAGSVVDTVRTRWFGESVHLPSASMEPALLMGDYVMTTPLSGENVVRNQIIVFRWSPDSSNQSFSRVAGEAKNTSSRFVSRVVGMPGDTLAMRSGRLLVNGHEVAESFAFRDTTAYHPGDESFAWQKQFLADTAIAGDYHGTRDDWGPLLISRNAYFVLGDNRDNALDSRYRGLVAAGDVVMTPDRVYYSRDPETGKFRWDRIGKIVRTSTQ